MITVPRMLRVEMSFHTQACPIIEFLLKRFLHRFGLKSEGISGEIDHRFSFVQWKVEFIAESPKAVGGILRPGEFKIVLIVHAGAPKVSVRDRSIDPPGRPLPN